MSDQNSIFLVIALAAVVFGLWVYSGRQKRKFEDEKRQRKRELERIKAEAKAKKE